ncbi:MAG: response regulator [Thermodesulfobacteriota bacterium]
MMKILIAEDDPTSRLMLRSVLEKQNYEVLIAEDGGRAWDLLQTREAPQLAIIDWMMPGLTGLELCRGLRAQERAEPLYLILLTSKGELEDIVAGLEAGADDHIAKPYDNRELMARVNVGRRILELQARLSEKEKLQGALEMAGAVCHELNQPLQAVGGWSELLLMGLPPGDPKEAMLRKIKQGVERIGELTRKMMKITKYKTRDYLNGKSKIVDLDGSSTFEE